MKPMFVLLGIAIALYTTFAAYTGSVYAKRGPLSCVIEREESPRYFWVVIACYALLSIALVTVF